MASSTLFRGRRIVDPVPVQRGPLPRDGKYQSSFSGSIFLNVVSKTIIGKLDLLRLYLQVIWSVARFVLIKMICLCDLRQTKLDCSWLFFCEYKSKVFFYSQFYVVVSFRFSGSLGKCRRSKVRGRCYSIQILFCLLSISYMWSFWVIACGRI